MSYDCFVDLNVKEFHNFLRRRISPPSTAAEASELVDLISIGKSLGAVVSDHVKSASNQLEDWCAGSGTVELKGRHHTATFTEEVQFEFPRGHTTEFERAVAVLARHKAVGTLMVFDADAARAVYANKDPQMAAEIVGRFYRGKMKSLRLRTP